MNADNMMKYGHQTLMRSLDAVDNQILELEGACGFWSVKNILAHLTTSESLLVDALKQIEGQTDTPTLTARLEQRFEFNDLQVEARAAKSYDEQLTEYLAVHEEASTRLAQIPIEKRREKGVLAWYGDDYDLEDFIVYTVYAHKREHAGQIDVFKDVHNTQEVKI